MKNDLEKPGVGPFWESGDPGYKITFSSATSATALYTASSLSSDHKNPVHCYISSFIILTTAYIEISTLLDKPSMNFVTNF